MNENTVIESLLKVELENIAHKLGFINSAPKVISKQILYKTISLIDKLSMNGESETNKKLIITMSAILWTYRKPEWNNLKEFLIVMLSRIGYAPSTLMIDENYDKELGQYSSFTSYINQVDTALNQMKYEIVVGSSKFLITDFQKRVWKGVDEYKALGISAPTSAGKSFIILLKAIDLLFKKPGNIVYIVPTLSLVSQVSEDFVKELRKFGLHDYKVLNSFSDEKVQRNVYVLTQERALAAFAHNEHESLKELRLLIVDEVQNLERVANEGDHRAKILYDTLLEFNDNSNIDKIICAGPRLKEIEKIPKNIFNLIDDVESVENHASPVVNFSYTITKSGKGKNNKFLLKLYNDISAPLEIEISNVSKELKNSLGKSQYKDDADNAYYEYLRIFTEAFTDQINIIFSPTVPYISRIANGLSSNSETKNTHMLNSLSAFIGDTVHSDYPLCGYLKKGIVFHHGRQPHHVRNVIEKAITSEENINNGYINNIICTTTLMQGVNLPVQNVIMRNSLLAASVGKGELSEYEILNLQGRAGRLMKDFVGRSFILDETMLDKAGIDLTKEIEKQISPGYGEKYTNHKEEITELLEFNIPLTKEDSEYGYLVTYIRNTILLLGKSAGKRLKSVGISLSNSEFSRIKESLSTIEISHDLLKNNRYWDPLDLEGLMEHKQYFIANLPKSFAGNRKERSESSTADKLKKVLHFMGQNYSHCYKRTFGDDYHEKSDKRINQIASLAASWMKEVTLKKILSSSYYSGDSSNIDTAIQLMQNKISFNLPELLKPLYDIAFNDRAFLEYIELGAYKPTTRKLIGLGIARETAIFLNEKYFNRSQELSKEDIIRKIQNIYVDLDYWYQVQLDRYM